MVRSLPESVTVNQLKIHFQKKRNAGGSIEKVAMLEGGKNGARITFDDPAGTPDLVRANDIARE